MEAPNIVLMVPQLMSFARSKTAIDMTIDSRYFS
jgi:hypothetical protein